MMKRTVLSLVGLGLGSVALMLALQAQEHRRGRPVAQAQQGRTVFTFSDDAQMQEFARLWNQREGVLARIAVLQRYWNQEQSELAVFNQQLLSQYHVDANHSYSLDTDRKALIEHALTPDSPTPPPSGPAHAPSPRPTVERGSQTSTRTSTPRNP